MEPPSLPPLALSVRQPWAWAIVAGHKVIENRSLGAIRAGGMGPGSIALHAASAMTEAEYTWGLWRLERHGVRCPEAADLVRGGIIGTVRVTGVITESDSEWFGGEAGLTLEGAAMIDPIPAKGALGYFRWTRAETFAPPLPWIERLSDPAQGSLFEDLPPGFKGAPEKPFGRKKGR